MYIQLLLGGSLTVKASKRRRPSDVVTVMELAANLPPKSSSASLEARRLLKADRASPLGAVPLKVSLTSYLKLPLGAGAVGGAM